MTRTEKNNGGIDKLSAFLILAIIVIAVISVNCYIEKYEKDYQRGILESELSDVQNDYALLKIEYQSRTSYAAVSEYAEKELGMSKLSPYQTEYLDRGNTETMCVVEPDEKTGGFAERVSKAFSVVLEYFR